MPNIEPQFPIKVVAKRTGLSAHVIRIWERRYRAVQPARTASNRRSYTEADITRLSLLKRATETGISIGNIAHLSLDQLDTICHNAPLIATPAPRNSVRTAANPIHHIEACLEHIRHYDGEGLEAALERADLTFPRATLLEDVIAPLLVRVGAEWEEGCLRVGHEHLASQIVRSFLGRIHVAMRQFPGAPLFLAATPSGQTHELGALIAAIAANLDGWNTAYLGCDLPAEDIAAAALDRDARAIGLSMLYTAETAHIEHQLATLRRYPQSAVPILVGGAASRQYTPAIEQLGCTHVATQRELRATLAAIRKASLRSTAP